MQEKIQKEESKAYIKLRAEEKYTYSDIGNHKCKHVASLSICLSSWNSTMLCCNVINLLFLEFNILWITCERRRRRTACNNKKEHKTIHNLCKISGFHGRDYEECRFLGYKNPVHTSQETHYISAAEPSQLMLCKI
jgi:hypothetical protein